MEDWDDDPVVKRGETLKQYFDNDGRYTFEGHVGSGVYGDVYKLKRIDPGSHTCGRMAAKFIRSHGRESALVNRAAEREIQAMRNLKGAMHIVRILDVPDDPLEKEVEGAEELGNTRWMYMEWVENGTLGAFMERAQMASRRLPSRMLWHFFKCLIRMGVALSWPDAFQQGESRLEKIQDDVPDYIYQNTDVHVDNLMIGSFDENDSVSEHRLAPIIKMIDLGMVQRRQTTTQEEWQKLTSETVHTMGVVMSDLLEVGQSKNMPSFSWPDSELDSLVRRCVSVRPETRPTWRYLLTTIEHTIQGRTADYYTDTLGGDGAQEEDDAIMELTREFILDADTESS
ncbi:kinase-like domain-containing protein [Xylariales sp. AK1849]|nr:kinase-like domain-containing protein [Xylariales sp. AK1849]